LDEGATIMAVELIDSLTGATLVLNRARTPVPLRKDVAVVHVTTGNMAPAKVVSYIVFALMSLYIALCRRPNSTHYLPLRAPGIARHLHARVLSIVCTNFNEILFQIPSVGTVQRRLMQFAIKVPSVTDHHTLVAAGVRKVSVISPTPKNPRKGLYNCADLRKRYGLGAANWIITHVGHITPGRGLDFILRLAEHRPDIQWLLVISSRAGQDLGPLPINVTLLTRFVEDIFEIYCLSDGYIFPLRSENAAVSTPLSLLEAAKANIPIICSDFPNFRRMLDFYDQVRFIDMSDEVIALNQVVEQIDRWMVTS
jgi:glycosyltransferase involved in cell wall biosynthesis